VPGDLSGKDLFKRILATLAGRAPKDLRKTILKVPFEDIREFVPYGVGRILDD
jgi:hypothetical protein